MVASVLSAAGVVALCRNYEYVINVGMSKTGTSSVAAYFRGLGYSLCPNYLELMRTAEQKHLPLLTHVLDACPGAEQHLLKGAKSSPVALTGQQY